jgi:hypothetical protein
MPIDDSLLDGAYAVFEEWGPESTCAAKGTSGPGLSGAVCGCA